VKTLPAGLAASLASGVTTLAWCFRLARGDGVVKGFTDHDRDLSFGGDTYEAASGLTASEFAQSQGLAVDTIEAAGALASAALTEDDLAKGLWDGASIEVWWVDWSNVADRVLVFEGSIGEVRRGPLGFTAEVRSLAHALAQPAGRVYSILCDADLGDARCGVDLDLAAFKGTGTVAAVTAARRAFTASGLAAFAASWFARGRLLWTSGANAGRAIEVKRHGVSGSTVTLELMEAMPFDIAPGNGFTVTAGCDKSAATCQAKFSNILNHRGFPFMPGNDWVTSYPNAGEGNDGGRRGSAG
jgi:uncharacterized phage protein (TIGR02218 family)